MKRVPEFCKINSFLWNGHFSRLKQEIKQHPNIWQCPLINYPGLDHEHDDNSLKTNEEKNVEIGTMITELKTSMAEYREMAESNRSNLSRVAEMLEQIHTYRIGENAKDGPCENSEGSHNSNEVITE